jgi:hypothetical protein
MHIINGMTDVLEFRSDGVGAIEWNVWNGSPPVFAMIRRALTS